MCFREVPDCNVQYESKTKYYIHCSGCFTCFTCICMSFAVLFHVYCVNNFVFYSVFCLKRRHRFRCNPSLISYKIQTLYFYKSIIKRSLNYAANKNGCYAINKHSNLPIAQRVLEYP